MLPIRVGGSIPVIFSYFGEFQPNNHRGKMISALSTFWMAGNILTAGLAWAIIPREHLGYHNPDGFSYESWRIFVAVCCIPAASSVLTFLLMPESPKFLLEVKIINCQCFISWFSLDDHIHEKEFKSIMSRKLSLIKKVLLLKSCESSLACDMNLNRNSSLQNS